MVVSNHGPPNLTRHVRSDIFQVKCTFVCTFTINTSLGSLGRWISRKVDEYAMMFVGSFWKYFPSSIQVSICSNSSQLPADDLPKRELQTFKRDSSSSNGLSDICKIRRRNALSATFVGQINEIFANELIIDRRTEQTGRPGFGLLPVPVFIWPGSRWSSPAGSSRRILHVNRAGPARPARRNCRPSPHGKRRQGSDFFPKSKLSFCLTVYQFSVNDILDNPCDATSPS